MRYSFALYAVILLLVGAVSTCLVSTTSFGSGPMNTDAFDDPLPPAAVTRLGTTLYRPGWIIDSLSVSPDGHLLACGDRRHRIHVFDARTGKKRYFLEPNKDEKAFRNVVFNMEKNLFACHCDLGIQIRDAKTGRCLRTIQEASCVFERPHGGRLLGAGDQMDDDVLKIWNWTAAKELLAIKRNRNLEEGRSDRCEFAFAPNGKAVATCGYFAALEIWDTGTGRSIRRLTENNEKFTCVAFSPDGQSLATGDGDGFVRLWDLAKGTLRHRFQADSDRVEDVWFAVEDVCFSPDGKVLAACGPGEVIRRIDPNTGKKLPDIKTGERINCLAFTPDSKRLFSGGYGSVIRQWDMTTGAEIGDSKRLGALLFFDNGKKIITGGDQIRQWDASTGKLLQSLKDSDRAFVLALSQDGKTLASANMNGKIELWDLGRRAECLRRLDLGKRSLACVAFSQDDRTLALASGGDLNDPVVELWNLSTGKKRASIKAHRDWVTALAFSPNGKLLASGGSAAPSDNDNVPSIVVWDLETMKQIFHTKAPSFPTNLAFSPDNKTLAFCEGSSDEPLKIHLWNVLEGVQLNSFSGGKKSEQCVSFSPDGQFLASGGYDNVVRVWEVKTGRQVEEFKGHMGLVWQVSFSPDGTRIASVSQDTTVLIWQWPRNASKK